MDAVLRIKETGSLEAIQIMKKLGGKLHESYLDEGFLLDKKIGVNQPKRIENARILISNTAMDTDKIKIFGSRVRVDSVAKVAQIEEAEKKKMKEKVDKILKHDITCFINRQLIYNYPEQLFADAGVMAIEHADFEGVERLALVVRCRGMLSPKWRIPCKFAAAVPQHPPSPYTPHTLRPPPPPPHTLLPRRRRLTLFRCRSWAARLCPRLIAQTR